MTDQSDTGVAWDLARITPCLAPQFGLDGWRPTRQRTAPGRTEVR